MVATAVDWPFWVVFGICSVIGMVDLVAGAVAFAGTVALVAVYVRARARFRCVPCQRTHRLSELFAKDAVPKIGA